MVNTTNNDSYRELLEKIGPEKFQSRLRELMESAQSFIGQAGYGDSVQCNERIMTNALLDYYSDIFRLEEFHSIEHPRTDKIFAYTVAWIVRRKPLQFVRCDDEERDMFVNERFAVFLMINECLTQGEKKFVPDKYRNKLDEYVKLLLYYFKYRDCNPQAIELAIESFKMGMLME